MATRPLPNCTDPTPRIPEGPYYREGVPLRDELNVTGESGPALVLQGRVLGPECAALSSDFEVVIWHARQDGTYDFTGADFQGYGRVQPAADGTFCVSTLRPPSYTNGTNVIAQHVHIAILREGVRVFTTQVYFDGDPALASAPAPAQCIRGVEPLAGGAVRVAMDIVLDGPSAGL
jgi:protocatechuate 3,4-dioxygenase beta subunit